MPLDPSQTKALIEQGYGVLAFLLLVGTLIAGLLRMQNRTNEALIKNQAQANNQIIDRLDRMLEQRGTHDESMLLAMAEQHNATRACVEKANAQTLEAVRGITAVCALAQQVQQQKHKDPKEVST